MLCRLVPVFIHIVFAFVITFALIMLFFRFFYSQNDCSMFKFFGLKYD